MVLQTVLDIVTTIVYYIIPQDGPSDRTVTIVWLG